jgi:uncharacterized membrane protein YfcA
LLRREFWPPVTANVSNTVALVFSGVGSVSGSKPELAGQARRIVPFIIASVLGGATGGLLLLTLPSDSFELTVPWLIAGAAVAILLPRRPLLALPDDQNRPILLASIALIGVYGGYFGAASGVLLLALLLSITSDTFARSNAIKNVLSVCSNAVAAAVFITFGSVRWLTVLPLGLGFLIGGRLGPIIVRNSPSTALRIVIAAAGIALAVVLAWQAYAI